MAKIGRAAILMALTFLVACNQDNADTAKSDAPAEAAAASAAPSSTPAATPASAAQVGANELGLIPILEYHQIGPTEARWVRTPANFRADLERLYNEGYYLTSLDDIVQNKIRTPAGKTPYALTFDDSSEGQFRYLPDGRIDPDCAVGILEDFAKRHPDGGKAGTFFVLPQSLFGQPGLEKQKLTFLAENGYQIGNHTLNHNGLSKLPNDKVDYEIGTAVAKIQEHLPGYRVLTLAYPYGMVPKDLSLVAKYHEAAFLVGSEPMYSPLSVKHKPMLIPRVQAIDSEFARHFPFLNKTKGWRYVSDGDPDRFSVPEDLPSGLAGTLAPHYAQDPRLIRYKANAS